MAYRPYLDGLRAVAVLGVLVYHLNRDWLPGGFLGVDVFFVLSGFLITTLLLAEHRDTGRIYLPAFWARRLRRLFPALIVVLVVMAIYINLQGDLLARGQARGDLLSTLFYVANWRFIVSGQSYFAQYVAVSPDRHTWSLAIEEQFYLLWPIVVAAVLTRSRRALGAIAAVVAVGSILLMAASFDSHDPSRAYYGTDTRIFEILFGALLAIALAGGLRDRVLRLGGVLAPVGLAVLLAAYLWLADDNAAYYFGGSAVISLAVVALIAGLEGGSALRRVLSLRPLVLVGLVSYGLYLWHFPIITIVNESLGPTTLPGLALLATVATLAVTAASYVIVERPIRRGGLLVRYKLTPRRLARVVPVASGAVAAVIVFTTIGGISSPSWDTSAVANGPDPTIGRYGDAPPSGTSEAVAPGTAGPGVSHAAPSAGTPSGGGPGGGAVSPGPGWQVGVVGDSVMASAVGGLEDVAASRGWGLINASHPGCPVGYDPLYDNQGTISPFAKTCQGIRGLHDQLIAAHPNLVIWHDLQSVLARRSASGALLLPGTPAWTDSLFAEWNLVLGRFSDAGIPVVVVLPPLRSQQAAGCGNVPLAARCQDIQQQDSIIRTATEDWFASLGGRSGVYLIEVDDLLCPNGYACPSSIDGVAVRMTGWDQTHFTDAGARWFAPRLIDLAVAAIR